MNLKTVVLRESKLLLSKTFEAKERELLGTLPGKISDFSKLEVKENTDNVEIELLTTPLALELETGSAYKKPVNFGRVTSWAASRGLGDAAVPIWIALSHKRREEKHKGWTHAFTKKIQEVTK